VIASATTCRCRYRGVRLTTTSNDLAGIDIVDPGRVAVSRDGSGGGQHQHAVGGAVRET